MDKAMDTRKRLLDAAETVICAARGSVEISVRRIATEAGTNVAAISYHFGSLEGLAVETARRVYSRLNAARLAELQAVVDSAAPRPPALGETVRALIGTSIRWSHDPTSPYAVFIYVSRLSSLSEHPGHFDKLVQDVEHHRIFAHYLRRAAPWFSEEEIAWRLAAALGVRSQFTRHADRCEVLTGRAIKTHAETVVDALCDIIVAMFADPGRARFAPRSGAGRAVPNVV